MRTIYLPALERHVTLGAYLNALAEQQPISLVVRRLINYSFRTLAN